AAPVIPVLRPERHRGRPADLYARRIPLRRGPRPAATPRQPAHPDRPGNPGPRRPAPELRDRLPASPSPVGLVDPLAHSGRLSTNRPAWEAVSKKNKKHAVFEIFKSLSAPSNWVS